MQERQSTRPLLEAAKAAVPVMLGYLTIGIPCGVMSAEAGLAWWQVLLVSCTFYSGAGQFMTASMLMVGSPLASLIASVALVSSRQMLYSAAFSPFFAEANKGQAALFAATVTDESFGVNLDRFEAGEWDARRATILNLCCMVSWTAACVVGCIAGELIAVPVAVMSFGMTSIFICLLACQKWDGMTALVAVVAAAVVVVAKALGMGGVAVLVGAVAGVAAGIVAEAVRA